MRPGPGPRLSARPARVRLTFMYAGTFLLLGTAIIAAILVLAHGGGTVAQAVPAHGVAQSPAAVSVQRSADLRHLLAISWIALAITAIAAAALGWYASGRVLRPLREMTATARTISAGSLHQRLALAGPDDEIRRLGDTLDDLLARLEGAFEAQRRFVANASHELRTPLTLERTLLQVALADPDASAATLRATCEELLASGRDQERLLEALLTLASSERGLERREPVDLAGLAGRVIERAGAEIERLRLQLETSLEPASAGGDPALLERLISNLIDNAVLYNTEGGELEITTFSDAARSELSVSNTGPAIAAHEVAQLFEPFQRLGGGRGATGDGHHGLGLSIVRAIAVAHSAEVAAAPRTGGGLVVRVSFPAS
jgi:signal transduction histidine kinase